MFKRVRKYLIFLALLVVYGIFPTFVAPTGNMIPTILIRDRFIGSKLAYMFGNPKRGDVVAFKAVEGNHLMVKRVIALPGDTIEFQENGSLKLNGNTIDSLQNNHSEEINEQELGGPISNFDFLEEKNAGHLYRVILMKGAPRTGFQYANPGQPYIVPEGHLFVLGDNRDNSRDSRYWGALPYRNVIAKIMFLWWREGFFLHKMEDQL